MTDKRLEDFGHLDIDQMSGRQLSEYADAVTNSAIDLLNTIATNSLPYSDLIKALETTDMQGPSEIAYGLMYGVLYGRIEQVYVEHVRTIKLPRKQNEQQPEG